MEVPQAVGMSMRVMTALAAMTRVTKRKRRTMSLITIFDLNFLGEFFLKERQHLRAKEWMDIMMSNYRQRGHHRKYRQLWWCYQILRIEIQPSLTVSRSLPTANPFIDMTSTKFKLRTPTKLCWNRSESVELFRVGMSSLFLPITPIHNSPNR